MKSKLKTLGKWGILFDIIGKPSMTKNLWRHYQHGLMRSEAYHNLHYKNSNIGVMIFMLYVDYVA
jgi:hypothetical protein